MADGERHQILWLWLAGSLLTMGAISAAIGVGFAGATTHFDLWGSPEMIVVYICAVLALICFAAAVRGARFPLTPKVSTRPNRDAGSVDPVTAAARARAEVVPSSQRFLHDHAAEMARERDVIRHLHAEYIETHPDAGPAFIAGLASLPAEWVVRRLEEMGETFRWPGGYKP